MYRARNHDAAGGCFGLQPRGDVDTVAVEVVTVDDQIAQVQSDAEDDGRVFGLVPVGLGHGLLEFDNRAEGVYCARELEQRAVAGQLIADDICCNDRR